MNEISAVWTISTVLVSDRIKALRSHENTERGEVVSWIIVTGLIAAAAIAIVGIVVVKMKDTANKVKTS